MPLTLHPGADAGAPDDAAWQQLTRLPEKRRLFADDLYFRECWADCLAVFGSGTLAMLQSLAILCAKPDAVAGRRLRPMVAYATEHGFAPLAAATFTFNRQSMRAIWCYDWHVYPVDRLAFSTLWYCTGSTVLFAFEDAAPAGPVPASVRLSALKGHASADLRSPGQLRARLNPPNRVLNFVHIPDEPADVVRELGILFDRDERRALLLNIAHARRRDCAGSHDMLASIAQLETTHAAHTLDVGAVMARVAALPGADADRVRQLRLALATHTTLDWDTLCALQPPEAPGLARWDFICLASHLIAPERPVARALMGATSPDQWLSPQHVSADYFHKEDHRFDTAQALDVKTPLA